MASCIGAGMSPHAEPVIRHVLPGRLQWSPDPVTKAESLQLLRVIVVLFATASVAACTATTTPASLSSGAAPRAAIANGGTILSMRSVSVQSNDASWRAALLASAGGSGGAADGTSKSLVEFIVRTDDGSTLSVVQPNEAGFHNGDRVIILRNDQTRLSRPS
jgi:outer membrane lipoprotein SlyB